MTQVLAGSGAPLPTSPTPGAPQASPVGTGAGSVGNQMQPGGTVGGLTGFTTTVYTPPPYQAALTDANGNLSRIWLNWFQSVASLLANTYPPVIGEYRSVAAGDLLDNTWLLCNGATPATSDYPKLSALLGGSGGTFTLPSIAGSATQFWFVKAL